MNQLDKEIERVESDFNGLRHAVEVAKCGGNPDLACWRDIERLLAAYDKMKEDHD